MTDLELYEKYRLIDNEILVKHSAFHKIVEFKRLLDTKAFFKREISKIRAGEKPKDKWYCRMLYRTCAKISRLRKLLDPVLIDDNLTKF